MARINLTPPTLTADQVSTFWSHVDKTPGQGPHGECWEWTGSRHVRDGYGHLTVDHRDFIASRLALFLATGKWPTRLALHRCDNPPCCRPEHLFEGSTKVNMQDAKAKGRILTGHRHWMHVTPERIRRGSQCGSAKLTEPEVAEIRRLVREGAKQNAVARQYKVSKGLINSIVLNKVWQHV